MNSVKRMTEILRIIDETGSAEVTELADQLHVTAKTIRLDLDKMAQMDLVERVHGGAILKKNGSSIFRVQSRQQTNVSEKGNIAQQALSHIAENDILIVDGGSTTLPLVESLSDQRVTVMTNDLMIGCEALKKPNIDLFVTGGKISSHRREGVYTLLGRDAEQMLDKYKVHKLFLAATALDLEQGLMVYSEDLAETKRAMMRAAEQIICLIDYSKFHKQAFTTFAMLEDINIIITDNRIPKEDIQALEKHGITVEVAP